MGAVIIEGLRIRLALVERWRAGRWRLPATAGRAAVRPCGEKSSVVISFSPHGSGRLAPRRGVGEKLFVLTSFSPHPP